MKFDESAETYLDEDVLSPTIVILQNHDSPPSKEYNGKLVKLITREEWNIDTLEERLIYRFLSLYLALAITEIKQRPPHRKLVRSSVYTVLHRGGSVTAKVRVLVRTISSFDVYVIRARGPVYRIGSAL